MFRQTFDFEQVRQEEDSLYSSELAFGEGQCYGSDFDAAGGSFYAESSSLPQNSDFQGTSEPFCDVSPEKSFT